MPSSTMDDGQDVHETLWLPLGFASASAFALAFALPLAPTLFALVSGSALACFPEIRPLPASAARASPLVLHSWWSKPGGNGKAPFDKDRWWRWYRFDTAIGAVGTCFVLQFFPPDNNDDDDDDDGSNHNNIAGNGVDFVKEAATDDANEIDIDIDELEDDDADSNNDGDSEANANATGFKKARLED
mmetsp:Transcript_17875/g.37393  ORF Transcript_17875/g.37393 Transcript_17875/m.37393 type:complete len:187 (-) Transcript_17875:163-723(-)